MTFFEAFVLGLVQGLGEFLPISSSAHLVIAPWIMQFKDPGLAFDVALHLGTLIAVVAYFWKDWLELFTGSGRYLLAGQGGKTPENAFRFRMLSYLVIATLPAAIGGVLLNDWAETVLRHPLLVAGNMAVMGVLLLVSDNPRRHKKDFEDITLTMALLIGVAQTFALSPGVSRSGATITMALFLGLRRASAARFSFLLSTPIIFGACLLKAKYIAAAFHDPKAVLGIVTALVSGFLSIKYLMKLVQAYSYIPFVYYRFLFAAAVFLIYFMRT